MLSSIFLSPYLCQHRVMCSVSSFLSKMAVLRKHKSHFISFCFIFMCVCTRFFTMKNVFYFTCPIMVFSAQTTCDIAWSSHVTHKWHWACIVSRTLLNVARLVLCLSLVADLYFNGFSFRIQKSNTKIWCCEHHRVQFMTSLFPLPLTGSSVVGTMSWLPF